jgi:hypothetical protein
MKAEDKLWSFKMSAFAGIAAGLIVVLFDRVLDESFSLPYPYNWVVLFFGFIITIFFLIFMLWIGDRQFIKEKLK